MPLHSKPLPHRYNDSITQTTRQHAPWLSLMLTEPTKVELFQALLNKGRLLTLPANIIQDLNKLDRL